MAGVEAVSKTSRKRASIGRPRRTIRSGSLSDEDEYALPTKGRILNLP
jgi:hypothetical protein